MGTQPNNLDEWNAFLKQKADSAWGWAHRGEYYLQQGMLNEALADLHQALALKASYPWALARRGEVFRLQERFQEALQDFDEALRLTPDYAWGLAHRGAALFQLRQLEEARSSLNHALALVPDYAWAFAYRTECFVALRQYEAALHDFDQVIALDSTLYPDDWIGERAMIFNFMGRYEESINICQPVLKQTPHECYALYSLTVADYFQNPSNRSFEHLGRVQGILKTSSLEAWIILYRLGGIAALMGNKSEAMNCLQEAGTLNPEPLETARHDPVWRSLHSEIEFQNILLNPL